MPDGDVLRFENAQNVDQIVFATRTPHRQFATVVFGLDNVVKSCDAVDDPIRPPPLLAKIQSCSSALRKCRGRDADHDP